MHHGVAQLYNVVMLACWCRGPLLRSKVAVACKALTLTRKASSLQGRSNLGRNSAPKFMAEKEPKLRLLCLHGYTQNSQVFSSKIGSMRKGLKSKCEFFFVDGPFESTGLPGDEVNEAQGAETGGRSWWQWHDTGPASRPSLAAQYTGWEQALQALLAATREHRPHGILGFSQGATAAALYLSALMDESVKAQLGDVAPPQFGILIAGFLPRDTSYADIVHTARPHQPTLFVCGKNDTLVSYERTKALMDGFDPSCLSEFTHDGAHLVPTCTGAFKAALVEFLGAQKAAAMAASSV